MPRFAVFGADMLRLIDDEAKRRRDVAARQREVHRRSRARGGRPLDRTEWTNQHWVPPHLGEAA